MGPVRRPVGRPLKFGRPSQALVLTLPEDVLAWLRSIHPDPAWAMVSLYERANRPRVAGPPKRAPDARLISLPGGVGLIVVSADLVRGIPGVSPIHLADGRALLALEQGRGMADLELAVVDVLERLSPRAPQAGRLRALRSTLRRWRTARVERFEARSIIVAVRRRGRHTGGELPRLQAIARPGRARAGRQSGTARAGGVRG